MATYCNAVSEINAMFHRTAATQHLAEAIDALKKGNISAAETLSVLAEQHLSMAGGKIPEVLSVLKARTKEIKEKVL